MGQKPYKKSTKLGIEQKPYKRSIEIFIHTLDRNHIKDQQKTLPYNTKEINRLFNHTFSLWPYFVRCVEGTHVTSST